MPLIETQDLWKTYVMGTEEVHALRGVSIQIERGDRILQRIADESGGRAFFPLKLQEVSDAFSEIQEELRSQYAVAYKPPDFKADGSYRPNQTCQSPPGFGLFIALDSGPGSAVWWQLQ